MWWIPLITTAASMAYDAYKSNQMKKEAKKLKGPDRKDYTLDKNAIKSGLMADLYKGKAITDKNIKQVGAARRMPSGAITTALGNANAQLGEGAAKINADLARAEMGGNMAYSQANQQFQGDMAGLNLGLLNMQNQNTQNYMGGLSKILQLWQGGYFNGMQQPMSTGQLNSYAIGNGGYSNGNLQPITNRGLDWSNSYYKPQLGRFGGN